MHLIGIVGRCYYNKDEQHIIQTHDMVRRMMAGREDCTCITILPTENIDYLDILDGKDTVNKEKIDYVLDMCDGFIVPGGTQFYHFDEYVIDYAIKKDKPLLAICLGFQAMCSMFAKNRDKFDMTTHDKTGFHFGKQNEYVHQVFIAENTLLSKIIGEDVISVNSVHHDLVEFKMDTLVSSGEAEDGVCEAVEYPNKKFILGLQWHPEYIMDENTEKIVDNFIDCC